MKLTVLEQRMLDGEQGEMMRKMIQILVAIGEALDAPRMVPVSSVHLPSSAFTTLGEGGKKLYQQIAAAKIKVKAYTTTNPSSIDQSQWQKLGATDIETENQLDVDNSLRSIGLCISHSCTPYLIGNLPYYGQYLAWGESTATAFANSVLGARVNAEGGPAAMAAALTGLTPEHDLHIAENRRAQIVVDVVVELKDMADYGALGYWTGSHSQNYIPAFSGLSFHTSRDDFKNLSGGLVSSCFPSMFHAVGITPEAYSIEQALGGKKPLHKLTFGTKELQETLRKFSDSSSDDVNWVALGCPHCSMAELMQISRLLEGKKVNSNVKFWVCTSYATKSMSDNSGYSEIIDKAGGILVTGTCPILATKGMLSGHKSIATNSMIMATHMSNIHGFATQYGTLQQCIDAAVSGRWSSF